MRKLWLPFVPSFCACSPPPLALALEKVTAHRAIAFVVLWSPPHTHTARVLVKDRFKALFGFVSFLAQQ